MTAITQLSLTSKDGHSYPHEKAAPNGHLIDHVWRVVDHSFYNLGGMFFLSPIYQRLPSARSVLSTRVVNLTEAYLAIPFRNFRTKVVALLPALYTTFPYGLKAKTNWTFVLTGAILEEVAFRWFAQSILLTAAPKAILRTVTPRHEHLVDHKIAQVARIIFTSALFALIHIVRFGDIPGMLLPQFLLGIYFSYRRERHASIAELSAVHFTMNALIITIVGGIFGELS